MEAVAWKWAELLLGLWVMLFPGDKDAGPWDYVDQDGRSARLTVSDGGVREGKSFLEVTVNAAGFVDQRDTFTLWVHRDAEGITVLEGVSLDAGNEVCHGAMPSVAPDATWMLSGKREFKVLRAGERCAARAGRCQVDDAKALIVRCGEETVRVVVSDTAGICRLERLVATEGPSQAEVDHWLVRGRAQLHRTGRPVGKEVLSLLKREIDPGPKPALPWPLDASVKVNEVEERTWEALYGDRDDLVMHMEVVRRAIHYLTAEGGVALSSSDAARERLQGLVSRMEKGTLYSKAEKEDSSGAHYFDLGWAVLLGWEAGLSSRNDGVTYLHQARKLLPDDPVVRAALSLAYEEAGLVEDSAEQMLAALDLSPSDRPDRARMIAALRGGRDDAAWDKAVAEARALVERQRPAVQVRIVLRDGTAVEGTLLDYGAAGYRVKVGTEVKQVPEDKVDHVVFLR